MQAKLNIVPFVSVDNMMKLVLAIGVERFLTELAGYIEDDFRRWELFDKTPRVGSHSARRRHRADADERRPALWIQIRQRPSEEHARGPADGDRVRRACRCRQRLSDAAHRDDHPDGAAHGRDVRVGRKVSGAGGLAHDGDHRQRRAVRIPGDRVQGAARHRQAAALRH